MVLLLVLKHDGNLSPGEVAIFRMIFILLQMMRNDSAKKRMLDVQKDLDEQLKMQTILEMDIEDRFVDNLTSSIFVDNPETSKQRTDPHISVSSTDDDNSKVGSQVALQPYRSYRALSEIKELNDLLTLADKRKSSSKSNEMMLRKSLILSGSSPQILPRDRMRAVKSCENVARAQGSTELDDLALMRANQPRVLIQSAATRRKQGQCEKAPPLINLTSSASDCTKSRESCQMKEGNSTPKLNNSPSGSTKKIPFDSPSNTLDSNSHTLIQDSNSRINTLQSNEISEESESSTLLNQSKDVAVGSPNKCDLPDDFQESSRLMNGFQEGTRRSHDDVIKWLHETEDDDAQSVSSVEYRSSMCSSFNDLYYGDLNSCRTNFSSSAADSKRNRKAENSGMCSRYSCFHYLSVFIC